MADLGGWQAALREADVAALRDVLGVLVDRVVPTRTTRGNYETTITWTATGEALRAAVSKLGSDAAA